MQVKPEAGRAGRAARSLSKSTAPPVWALRVPDKLPDRWASRDYPVLLEVARRVDEGQSTVSVEDVASATGRPEAEVVHAGLALKATGYLDVGGVDHRPVLYFHSLTARAYLVTGLHPESDDLVESLVRALQQAADITTDQDERSRLRRLADEAGGMTKGVLATVLTTWISAHVPQQPIGCHSQGHARRCRCRGWPRAQRLGFVPARQTDDVRPRLPGSRATSPARPDGTGVLCEVLDLLGRRGRLEGRRDGLELFEGGSEILHDLPG